MFNFLKKKSVSQDYFFEKSNAQYNQNVNYSNLNAYEIVSYIGKCVSIISDDISSLSWRIEKNGAAYDFNKNKDLAAILNKPNEILLFSELINLMAKHLLLDGNIFLYSLFNTAYSATYKKPDQFLIINPLDVTIFSSSGNSVSSIDNGNYSGVSRYEFILNNMQVSDKEKIIHTKLTSPHNMVRGMGLIQQNKTIFQSDELNRVLNELFLNNGVKSDLMFTMSDPLGASEQRRFFDQFREKYTGKFNFWKPIIAPYGLKAEKINITHEELQAIDLKKITREDITQAVFSIPAVRMGLSSMSKYNTAAPEMRMYYDTTLPSYYRPIQNAIQGIVDRFDSSLKFVFENKKIKDYESESKVYSVAFKDGVVSEDEYRLALGLSLKKQTIEPKKEKKINPDILYHEKAKNTKLKAEKDMFKATELFYKGMESEVLKNFDIMYKSKSLDKKDIGDLFNMVEMEKDSERVMKNAYTSIVIKAINDISEFYGNTGTDASFKNSKIRLIIDQLGVRYKDLVLNTRKSELEALIKTGLDEGKNSNQIRYDIQDYFKTFKGDGFWRADRIARSEVGHAYDMAAQLAYNDLGIEFVKVVGCTEIEPGTNCDTDGNKGKYPVHSIGNLKFHPNHIGTIVPVLKESEENDV